MIHTCMGRLRGCSTGIASGPREEGETLPDIFEPFAHAPQDRPFVVAQLGQSLDGRIATISGESRDISGGAALDHLHRIRAHVDAVVVGAGTIVADDPQLTVRRVAGKNPARVAIDPSGRLDGRRQLAGRRWRAPLFGHRREYCRAPGAELVRLDAHDGIIPPRAIVEALFRQGLRRILIEGGARTIAAFIEAGCVDRLHVLVAAGDNWLGEARTGSFADRKARTSASASHASASFGRRRCFVRLRFFYLSEMHQVDPRRKRREPVMSLDGPTSYSATAKWLHWLVRGARHRAGSNRHDNGRSGAGTVAGPIVCPA